MNNTPNPGSPEAKSSLFKTLRENQETAKTVNFRREIAWTNFAELNYEYMTEDNEAIFRKAFETGFHFGVKEASKEEWQ